MARKCQLTGKGPMSANKVSHSNRKTRTRKLANIQTKIIFIPEIGRRVRLRLSTSAIRTIDKIGLSAFLRKLGISAKKLKTF